MANAEQVTLLKHDVDAWNAAKKPGDKIDLHEADLNGADLRWVDLIGANLSGALLKGASFFEANLLEADLSGADLSGADLYGANLLEANLSGANLVGTNLIGAKLIGANLTKAKLRGANLRVSNLIGAKLRGANLRVTNLSGANLSGADLSEAQFFETVIGNVDLTGAIGLDTCIHHGPSTIDHRTLEQSENLPIKFLRGCGLSDLLIDYLPSLHGKAIEFYSCFISYSHADKPFARRLHDALQELGIRCWLDEHQILPGDDIYKQVDRGIRLWDKVLLCCSEESLTSWWVENEIDSAFASEQKLMKQRRERILKLIPLNLDGHLFSGQWKNGKAEQVKIRLAADFTGWDKDNDKFDEQFELLVKALRADDEAREHPPKSKL